jgi:hypothetical protein
MSGLNKRALYQMACTKPHFTQPTNSISTNIPVECFELKPISATLASQIPDGRVSGKLTDQVLQRIKANDAITVSSRATLGGKPHKAEGFKRSEILNRLGSGSLGLLTNAFLEQQIMTDEEIHSVQQRFYGLSNV